jgi:type IV pilus assembly protein PilF
VIRIVLRVSLVVVIAGGIAACQSTTSQMSKPQPDRAAEINLELGIQHFKKGNLSEAKDKIDRAIEQNPRNAKAQATAGLLYDRLGEPKKADAYFDRAMSLDSKDPDIANNYSAFLCRGGRFERGEKVALQAATNPLYKTPEIAYVNAGNCARSAGQIGRAEENYRKAIAVNPRFGAALYELSEVKVAQKDYMSARGFYQRFMEQSRTTPATLWSCVRIERGLNNTPVADNCAKRLRNEYPSSMETRALIESERKAE